MAENKKSFVLYSDNFGMIKQLPDDIAGKLFKHIFAYVNDENPISEDLLLNIAFEPIKMALKRDLKKYEQIKEKRSQAGKKSAELRQQNSTNPTSVDFVQQTSTNPTDSDSVNDSVSDSVIVNDILNNDAENFSSKNFDDDFQKFKILFYKNLTDDFDFTFEIQKIKNQLDQEMPEQEKTFLSQQLNFLISEKRKKVAPKKEINHEAFLETLLTSVENTSWRETIFMQHRINEIELKQKFKEFNVMLSSKKRIHKSEREYVDHFTNWLPTQKNSQPKKVSEFNHNR